MFTVGEATYTREKISGLLAIALNQETGGSSSYWATIANLVEPTTWEFESEGVDSHPVQDYPLNPGGAVIICNMADAGSASVRLDAAAIQHGLIIMHKKFPDAFAMLFDGDTDVVIAVDALIQCALLGDVLF